MKTTVKLGELVLKTWETEVTHGLNFLTYNGEIPESVVPQFAKQLNGKKKKDERN